MSGSMRALRWALRNGASEIGAPADLVLCSGALDDILADLSADRMRLTVIAGGVCFARG